MNYVSKIRKIEALSDKMDGLLNEVKGLLEKNGITNEDTAFDYEKACRDNIELVNRMFDESHRKSANFSVHQNYEFYSLYVAYKNINARCNRANHPQFKDYGGRGIKNHFESFEQFARHIGTRPSSAYSIDRIDNDRGYEEGNLRWATRSEQAGNRRPTFH